MKFLAIILITVFVIQVHVNAEKNCGAKLSQALWDVCGGKFYNLPLGKRAVPSRFFKPAIQNALNQPYIPGMLSDIFQLDEESFDENSRRTRMLGVVEECCSSGCTYEQLSTYCPALEL